MITTMALSISLDVPFREALWYIMNTIITVNNNLNNFKMVILLFPTLGLGQILRIEAT